jgi:hypothetical protein
VLKEKVSGEKQLKEKEKKPARRLSSNTQNTDLNIFATIFLSD